jgi:hypothetical protein
MDETWSLPCSSQDSNAKSWNPARHLSVTDGNLERSYPTKTVVFNARIGAQETLASCAPILTHLRIPLGTGSCFGGPLLCVRCQLISIYKVQKIVSG